MLSAGCEPDRIDVRKAGTESTGDYGRGALVAAIDRYTAKPGPAAFAQLAGEIQALTPRFDELVTGEAELNLVRAAMENLEAQADEPVAVRFERLATTVWPTLLDVPARDGESAAEYAERLCADQYAVDCKDVVAQYRPQFLEEQVWLKVRDRLREAVAGCVACREDDRYRALVARADRAAYEASRLAGELEDDADPSRWATAGDNAQPWSGAPLFERRPDGTARFRDSAIEGPEWTDALRRGRDGSEVLGAFLGAGARVEDLRALGRAARKAGYSALALQVREPDYPYREREYRLRLDRRGRRVAAADHHTIQVLVQALDAAPERNRLL